MNGPEHPTFQPHVPIVAPEPATVADDGGRSGVAQFTPTDRVAREDALTLWPDANLLTEPPAGYRPLELPDAWEPPAPAREAEASRPSWPTDYPWPRLPAAPPPTAPRTGPGSASQAPSAPASPPLAPAPADPSPRYVISAPAVAAAPPPARTLSPRTPGARPAPRSFRDLRTGPLEGREFPSMREFAVAAVLEAGYAEADVARLFRFAPWQLRAWVAEARDARFGPSGAGPTRP